MAGRPLSTLPRIVILDGHTLNPGDLSWEALLSLGEVSVYPRTAPADIIARSQDADLLIVNKVRIDADVIAQLPHLRCICVTATGYNNIDIAAARARQIPVCNVVGYGTDAVAQHVFALLLELTNHVALHVASVRAGDWSEQPDFSYWRAPLTELRGKTLGIVGFGRIGQQVATIGQAFGLRILAHHKHPQRDARHGVTFTDVPTLFRESDFISLNTPLTASNRGFVNAGLLNVVKPGAILINTARGELIDEIALANALKEGPLAAAALDVLSQEPPPPDHPLFVLPNCLITPHQAWASREARQRLLDGTLANVLAFLAGNHQNVVN
ncbi:MAG: D-2-hydroxyacid dehydrogenase [Lewinellaceae bacterium]|nr:D-2-hydroxyacid dehydrogenase [Lewinellaceae bacterium]